MANKKVSQLSATTEANDGVWLIMNNSGNTETFRIKREDLLSGTTQPPGLVNGTGVDSLQNADYLTSIPADASGQQAISIGYDSTATQLFSIVVGAQSSSTAQSGIVVGAGSDATAQRALTLGFLSKANQVDAICIGAESNSNGTGAITIGKFRQTTGTGAINVGYGNQSVSGNYSINLGGNNTGISSTGVGNVNIGGNSVNITGSTNYTTFLNLQTPPTSFVSNTTYTQNHASLGQTYNGYYDNLSGDTFTIDWDNGNSQKVYMTGNTTFDFTNVRNGATYKLQVVNGGTHSITGATASGYTILCEGGNIPNITNNGVDLCILEVMGTDILVRHFADFSAP